MSEEKKRVNVVKVTLSTKKVVRLREVLIGHQEQAAQAAAPHSGGNAHVLSMMMIKEMLKLLLVDINGKSPTASDREDLNSLFTIHEYNQLVKVIGKIMGDDMGKEPVLEFAQSSD